MRKILSILFSAVLLLSGISISIDRHFCSGDLVDVKVSFDGNLASCGMEKPVNPHPEQASLNKKCCEDQLTWYNFSNKYLPEYSRLSHPDEKKDNFPLSIYSLVQRETWLTRSGAWTLPPGENIKYGISLSEICVLRI